MPCYVVFSLVLKDFFICEIFKG